MLRYAIVGTNWLSHIYYHAIEAAGDRVAAVCSRSRERAAELGQGKALVYTELDEMLKNPDIDVVYLCIPNVLHADAALRCLRAGKHVLCEKPATVSAAEMEEILHTARTEGRIFAEAVMNFYSPVTDRLRAELAQDSVVSARLDYSQRSSKLDRLRAGEHITSFDRALYGGVLTDLGCYVLHFAVNLFGAPKKLDASAVFLGEVDGTDVLTLHYDGFDVSVTVSKCAHSTIGSEIQCDRATYTLKNLSVVLGVEKHTMDTCEEYECGISCPGWPIANPAMLPGVQERVVRRFDRWVRGEDLAAQQRLLQQSLTVQRLIEEAHRQIGY
ncbi:MAG: Gfo/Idh/MocA family oxidoreductase [Oscillospiraceae bacterium]